MPSKSPSSRSHRFNIHCSKDELDKLSLAANQANLSLSRYLIESGLSFSANSLSPFIRDNIEQIKFESALLQHHLDLLLNKKSYIEQLASLGELNNLISFLSFSAKSLHDIFLADSNLNQFNHNNCANNLVPDNQVHFSNNQFGDGQNNSHQKQFNHDEHLENIAATSFNNQLSPSNNNQLNANSLNSHLSNNNPSNSHQLNNVLLNSSQKNNQIVTSFYSSDIWSCFNKVG